MGTIKFKVLHFSHHFLPHIFLSGAGTSTVTSQNRQERKRPTRHDARRRSKSAVAVGAFTAFAPTLKRRPRVSFESRALWALGSFRVRCFHAFFLLRSSRNIFNKRLFSPSGTPRLMTGLLRRLYRL